jgi:hypothetical protein
MGRKHFSPPSAIIRVHIWALGINRQRIWVGKCKNKWLNSPSHRCRLAVLVWDGFGRNCYCFSNPVWINRSLLASTVLRRLCYFLPWGQFPPSILVSKLSIIPVLPKFQGDYQLMCRENSSEQRTQIQNGGWNAKLFSCF